jgi:hypothetical protein
MDQVEVMVEMAVRVELVLARVFLLQVEATE